MSKAQVVTTRQETRLDKHGNEEHVKPMQVNDTGDLYVHKLLMTDFRKHNKHLEVWEKGDGDFVVMEKCPSIVVCNNCRERFQQDKMLPACVLCGKALCVDCRMSCCGNAPAKLLRS